MDYNSTEESEELHMKTQSLYYRKNRNIVTHKQLQFSDHKMIRIIEHRSAIK